MKKLATLVSLAAATTVGVMAFAADANAEERDAKTGIVKLDVTVVYGRPGRPSAAIEVDRVKMKLPLRPLDGPSVAAVTAAAKKDPF